MSVFLKNVLGCDVSEYNDDCSHLRLRDVIDGEIESGGLIAQWSSH